MHLAQIINKRFSVNLQEQKGFQAVDGMFVIFPCNSLWTKICITLEKSKSDFKKEEVKIIY